MKYIIELNPDCVDGEFLRMPIRLAGEDQWIKTKALLTPYTEPDRKAIEDEVWEFVRTCLAMDGSDFVDAFDSCSYINLLEHSYQEAKAKYDEWLKQKDEIHVGEEIVGIYSNGEITPPLVVLKVEGDYYYGMYSKTGDFVQGGLNYEKTGRYFPEVAELLKKMRGEE